MSDTPQLGEKACKQKHVDGSPKFAYRERRHSTKSEVIVTQLGHGSPRPRSATTTSSFLATNRWLDGLSTPHSESMCELNSLVGRKEKTPADGDSAINATNSRKRKGDSLAERFSRWKSEAEPRSSWFLLFFCIMPVNILIGAEYITIGIYYVEFVDYFEVASATAAFVFTIRAAFISVFSIVTSSIIRKFSARSICVSGGIIYFASQVASSLAPNVYVLYVTNGILTAVGNNLAFMVSTVLIQKHFTTNRGFGGSCSTIGYSIGHLTGPVAVTFLIQKYGWRGSTLIMAAVLAHIAVFGALYREPEKRGSNLDAGIRTLNLSEERNAKEELGCSSDNVGLEPTENQSIGDGSKLANKLATLDCDKGAEENTRCLPGKRQGWKEDQQEDNIDKQRVQNKDETINGHLEGGQRSQNTVKSFVRDVFDCSLCREFGLILYCICSMLSRYNMSVFLQHMPRKAVKLGISKEEVALLMSVFGIIVMCCRILITLIADVKWINRMALYGCGVTLGGVGSYLTLIHSFAGFLAASAVHGIHLAMTNTIAFVVLVDMLGVQKLPKSMALFNLIVAFGSMTAAPVSGRIYDVTGDYDIPFILSGTLSVMAGFVLTVPVIIKKITGRDQSFDRTSEEK